MKPPRSTLSPPVVSLGDEDAVREILAETIQNLWSAVNALTRLRPSRRERFRVAIFGSARPDPSHWVYREVRGTCAALASMGCDIVTGGGPGLMQAANEGTQAASRAGGKSIGIRISLPFEAEANPFVDVAFEHATFFTRLQQFVLMSDAFIVVPGGIGTALEAFAIWQLLQVHHLEDAPLVLTGQMWQGLVEWARSSMLREGFELASPADLKLPVCVSTGAEAVAAIRAHLERWQAAGR